MLNFQKYFCTSGQHYCDLDLHWRSVPPVGRYAFWFCEHLVLSLWVMVFMNVSRPFCWTSKHINTALTFLLTCVVIPRHASNGCSICDWVSVTVCTFTKTERQFPLPCSVQGEGAPHQNTLTWSCILTDMSDANTHASMKSYVLNWTLPQAGRWTAAC